MYSCLQFTEDADNTGDFNIPLVGNETIKTLKNEIGIKTVRELKEQFLESFKDWLDNQGITTSGRKVAICDFLLAEIQRMFERQGDAIKGNLIKEFEEAVKNG